MATENKEDSQNTLYTGDNLYILNGLNSEIADLIYLDPPFNSKRIYEAPVGTKAQGTSFKDIWHKEDIDREYLLEMFEEQPELARFCDTLGKIHDEAMMSYITYMAQRVLELHRILKPTGSLYYHCDPTAGHYVKIMLDIIFGKKNFRNEIIWHYNKWTNSANYFQRNHDLIYFYAKDADKSFFKKQYGEFSESQKRNIEKGWDTNSPKSGRQLFIRDKDKFDKAVQTGEIDLSKYAKIIDRSNITGTAISDVFDINYISSSSKERVGYPTQKPLALLNRIIEASCPEKGVVLDPFCGCATTCVAAQKLGRHWIGIDIEEKAVDLLIQRLSDGGDDSKDASKTKANKGMFNDFIATKIVPVRTDLGEEYNIENQPKTREEIKNFLYQKQEGQVVDGQKKCKCKGCGNYYLLKDLEIDHIIPRAKHGQDVIQNFQLLCGNCNRLKSQATMEQLKIKLRKIREERLDCEFGE